MVSFYHFELCCICCTLRCSPMTSKLTLNHFGLNEMVCIHCLEPAAHRDQLPKLGALNDVPTEDVWRTKVERWGQVFRLVTVAAICTWNGQPLDHLTTLTHHCGRVRVQQLSSCAAELIKGLVRGRHDCDRSGFYFDKWERREEFRLG